MAHTDSNECSMRQLPCTKCYPEYYEETEVLR